MISLRPARTTPCFSIRLLAGHCLALLLTAGALTAAAAAEFPLYLQPLTGSNGETVTRLLREDLLESGAVTLVDKPGPGIPTASGSASGGRVNGTLTAPAPDRSVILTNLYEDSSLKQNTHLFADDLVFALTETAGVSASQIAFVATASGNPAIYLCDADGTNIRRLTTETAPCVSPALSRDAGFLTYTTYRNGFADLWRVDLNSGLRSQVVTAPGTNTGAALSPDGRRLALTMSHSGFPHLYITSASGKTGRPLTSGSGFDCSPSWAPDGSRLVFTRDDGSGPRLEIISSAGGRPRPLRPGPANAAEPAWSPDGRFIAFTTRIDGVSTLALTDPSGARLQLLGPGASPSWAADSAHLVFTSGSSLLTLNLRTARRKTLLAMPGLATPVWTH